MRLLDSQYRINELMARFVAQIKGATAMRRTDINLVSETVLIPLFAEVYGYTNLENLNVTEETDYPGVDLGDKAARVAFQITATSGSTKVKDTLQKFVKHELYKDYDHLVIYILTEKQQSYSGSAFEEIIQDRFIFDKDNDIRDYRNVLKIVAGFHIDQTRRIESILEANFGDESGPLFQEVQERVTEVVCLNLLEVFFPETLCLAEVTVDRDQIVEKSKSHRIKVARRSSTRNLVRAALEQIGLSFGVDWVCYEQKIITFHDLSDPDIPLSKVVDLGTVTPLSSDEFYEIDENYERVFKSLLRRCLQQKLYHKHVRWQNQDKLYIFSEEKDGQNKRKVEWRGKRKAERTVYERVMKTSKPDETLYCKHLAFRTQFRHLGDQWYTMIKPEWFFSYDGYKKSFYSAEKVDYLKKNENNQNVFNHLRFIAHFLTYEEPPELFEETRQYPYPFLWFGKLAKFDSAAALDDKEWLPNEPKERKSKLENSQQIPLSFDL